MLCGRNLGIQPKICVHTWVWRCSNRHRQCLEEAEDVYAWLNHYDLLTMYKDDKAMVTRVKDATKALPSRFRKGDLGIEDLDEYYVRVSTKEYHKLKDT